MLSESWRSSEIRVVAGGVVVGFHCTLYLYRAIAGVPSAKQALSITAITANHGPRGILEVCVLELL